MFAIGGGPGTNPAGLSGEPARRSMSLSTALITNDSECSTHLLALRRRFLLDSRCHRILYVAVIVRIQTSLAVLKFRELRFLHFCPLSLTSSRPTLYGECPGSVGRAIARHEKTSPGYSRHAHLPHHLYIFFAHFLSLPRPALKIQCWSHRSFCCLRERRSWRTKS